MPKKAQRTKGNVKPSSSSQAAQLLAASGQASTGFIGFSNQPAFVPASETYDEAESALDGDFRIVLRKFSKRDTVTKTKALQEFITLCKSKDDECIKAVVPFWPRIYNKMAIDVDHKVRELSQKALSTLAARVGKAIAPHLKSIMGIWMVSMCDTYPTVASAANGAFVSTFPPAKQAEAVRFCRGEITECLMNNILKQTPQTLSEPLTTSAEDMEGKYLRVVSSSFQALRKLLFMLPPDSVKDSMVEHLTSLLSSPALWKHAKSTVPTVKSGVLSILSATCQLCPTASGQVLNKIAPYIFSCLDSADPNLISYSWEATLCLINAHQDCWQHVNWQKAVWPKLKHVLERGCSGQAVVVAPCLLPVLSKIPNRNFIQFFDSFRLGFHEDSVLNSHQDTSALMQSFIECIQYSIKCIAESGNDTAGIKNVIMDQVLVVVQASLTDPKPGLSKTELYACLCPLLTLVNTADPKLESDFWSDLSAFIRGRLLAEYISAAKDIRKEQRRIDPPILQRIKLLVQGLVFQQSATTGKKERVRFATKDTIHPQKKNYFELERQTLSNYVETFISDLFVAVFKLASVEASKASLFFGLFKDLSVMHIPPRAAERLTSKSDPVAIAVAIDLGLEPGTSLINWSDDDLVKLFKSQLNLDETVRGNSYSSFLYNYVVKLLLQAQMEETREACGGAKFTDHLVLTMFAFVSYVDEHGGTRLLSAVLDNLTHPQITCQFIEHLLGHAKFVPACKQLVEGSELAGKIEKLTMSAVDTDKIGNSEDMCEAVWKMLTSVVSSLDESDNHLFSQSCLDAVISSCQITLRQLQECNPSQRADTINSVVGLVQALFDKHKVSTHAQLGELVLSLLQLLLHAQCSEEGVAEELKSGWQAGFCVILEKKSHTEIQQHIHQSCAVIKDWVLSKVDSYDSLIHVCNVVKLLIKLLVPSMNGRNGTDDDNDDSNKHQEKDGDVDEDFDIEMLSSAADNLLIEATEQVDCINEVHEYLYLSGNSPCVASASPDPGSCVSLQTYIAVALYNLAVVTKGRSNLCSHLKDSQTEKIYQWSDTQLCCMVDTGYRLTLIETALKVRPVILKEFPENMVTILWTDLVNCLKTLSLAQLAKMDELVVERYADSYLVFLLGLEPTLELVANMQSEETGKVMSSVSATLLSLQMKFLHQCMPSAEVANDVMELLTKSGVVTAHSLCEAFTLATTVIMSCENISVRHLADCISGFLAMARAYDLLSVEVKLSLFQQVSDIVKQLKESGIYLLSSSDTVLPPIDQTHFNVNIVRALKSLVVPCNEQFWEVTLCALVEWIQVLMEVKVSPTSEPEVRALLVSVCELTDLAAVTFSTSPVITDVKTESSSQSVTEKAQTEWKEFFSEGIFTPLLQMFVSLASASSPCEPIWTLVLGPLSSAASQCPSWLVLGHELPACLTATDMSSLPDSLKTLLNTLCPLLMSRQRCLEVAAYKLLKSVIEEIPKHETNVEEDDKQDEELRSPPEAMIQQAEIADKFLESLKVVQVEDHIVMDNGTEERAQAMGYLLSWQLLLQLFRCSPNQLRAKYAQYFKAHDSVSNLLDRVFRLIPPVPSPSMLEFSAELVAQAEESETELATLALRVYRQCLEILPAMVRTWWVDQDRKASNFIDRFTTQYLSSSLIWQQITSAQSTESDMEGISIRARPAAREVSATYEMAEVTINMSIVLPENYPLGKLEVSCDKRVGVSQAQWDRWLLQLNIFLQHQNGSIIEGLRLWKGNIDKKFEGIDDCMICFSVIHGTTFQLPRLTCKTCRKKFHSACLYKWFNTSQKSSCPLCRNLF